MTSRQRIEAALQHREPDRTPVFEYVLLPPVAAAVLGRPFVDYAGDGARWLAYAAEVGWEAAVRQYACDRLDLAEILGHDLLYVVPNPLPVVKPWRAARPTSRRKAAAPPADPVRTVFERVTRQETEPAGLTDEQVLVYVVMEDEMRRRGLDLPILAPAYAHGIWTDRDLMQTMLLDPGMAHRHFREATRRALAQVERYLALGIRQIGIGGDFAGNRPLISPAAYRQFIVPPLHALSGRIQAADGVAINASDGNLWSVIEDFLIATGVDGYLEIDSHAGMDLPRLKACFGDRITFYGNMDCGQVLSFATPAEVRSETHAILRAGWGKGGHIFCASNAITASVPLANYAAMANAYREFFGLPECLPEPH